jgi:hypothetical protein
MEAIQQAKTSPLSNLRLKKEKLNTTSKAMLTRRLTWVKDLTTITKIKTKDVLWT